MQIEKAMINDRLRVSKSILKISHYIYNFAKIYREICYFLKKITYFWTVFIVFYVYKQKFTAQ